jgi:DNA invertase Pin-like site-specific DNA recombinase
MTTFGSSAPQPDLYEHFGFTPEKVAERARGVLERGDTLIVSELSRLGRSVGEIMTRVDRLVRQQIRVFALKKGLRLTGAQDLQITRA